MNHAEIEELLAAYAIDAVDPDEVAEIEAHLAGCQSCRAEVTEHRETAAVLNDSRAEVTPPPELWDRLLSSISGEVPAEVPGEVVSLPERERLSRSDRYRARWRRLVLPYGTGALGAVAAALVVVLALQVNHLNNEVNNLQASRGLAAAVATAVAGPHQEVMLTSARGNVNASVVVAPSGNAYWVGSTLPSLTSANTYQVWSSVHGRLVSVAVIGPDPRHVAAFHLDGAVSRLLVTVEPAGGVPAPTTTPVIQGPV
jgi:anti-sigma factor RsiW